MSFVIKCSSFLYKYRHCDVKWATGDQTKSFFTIFSTILFNNYSLPATYNVHSTFLLMHVFMYVPIMLFVVEGLGTKIKTAHFLSTSNRIWFMTHYFQMEKMLTN